MELRPSQDLQLYGRQSYYLAISWLDGWDITALSNSCAIWELCVECCGESGRISSTIFCCRSDGTDLARMERALHQTDQLLNYELRAKTQYDHLLCCIYYYAVC